MGGSTVPDHFGHRSRLPTNSHHSGQSAETRIAKPRPSAEAVRTSGKAVASLVLGILSLLLGCFVVGVVTGAIAMVLGHQARLDMRRSQRKLEGRGLATAGFILGLISVILGLLVGLLTLLGFVGTGFWGR